MNAPRPRPVPPRPAPRPTARDPHAADETLTVSNATGAHAHAGKTFTVRLVRAGTTFGREGRRTWPDNDHAAARADLGDALVEYYDAAYAGTDGFDPHGQFVSSYYASTLLERTAPETGINLEGGVPSWSVDAAAQAHVTDWLRTALGPDTVARLARPRSTARISARLSARPADPTEDSP